VPPTLGDRVRHILEAIEEIEHALAGKSFESLAADRFLSLGVERLLEIICEASRRIPTSIKASETGIEWHKMVDFGNRLRHTYHRVDAAIVWNIIKDDLPPLKAFVTQIISDEEREKGDR
jgi:uncharacterized protein with HEPN domain